MAIEAEAAHQHRAGRLAEQRRGLPDQPGVYLFRDARGRVIYVGKAKSIRKRVASHFSNPTLYAATVRTGIRKNRTRYPTDGDTSPSVPSAR